MLYFISKLNVARRKAIFDYELIILIPCYILSNESKIPFQVPSIKFSNQSENEWKPVKCLLWSILTDVISVPDKLRVYRLASNL